MKSSMTFIQSNGCTEIDLILKQIWWRFIWRQVSFYEYWLLHAVINMQLQSRISNRILCFNYINVRKIVYTSISKKQRSSNYISEETTDLQCKSDRNRKLAPKWTISHTSAATFHSAFTSVIGWRTDIHKVWYVLHKVELNSVGTKIVSTKHNV